MAVVTVTRQYGSGGSLVARRVAERLGWTVIDNEFVGEVARRAGLPAEAVAAREERSPSLIERLGRTLAISAPEMFVQAAASQAEPDEDQLHRITERVIAEAAAHGRVVLVGRGATAYLATAGEAADVLHVYVVAPRETRIRTIVERMHVTGEEAARQIHSVDAARERYLEHWYGRRRDEAANYHLVVNTAWLGYEGAAEIIADAARRRGME
ncbi:MAG TPA: cytidylate kinase-like family protein [Gemmatimonadales bacterium]|nr:cytidylate kinase-like family protein [Gemmatimonadales bacterium]